MNEQEPLNRKAQRRLRAAQKPFLATRPRARQHIESTCANCGTRLGEWIFEGHSDMPLARFRPRGHLLPAPKLGSHDGVQTYKLVRLPGRWEDASETPDGRFLANGGPGGLVYAQLLQPPPEVELADEVTFVNEVSSPPASVSASILRGLCSKDETVRQRAQEEVAAVRDAARGIPIVIRVVCPRNNCKRANLLDSRDLSPI